MARDSITAIGGGSTMVGLLLALASDRGRHRWLLLAGQVLIALGAILFIIRLWKQRQS
jgi:hypothetical protein